MQTRFDGSLTRTILKSCFIFFFFLFLLQILSSNTIVNPPTMNSDDEIDKLPDRIADTFIGRTIFMTGGSGFLGKVLMEKILRKCPQVKTIYLLLRMKKGKSSQQRIHELFTSPVRTDNPAIPYSDMPAQCLPYFYTVFRSFSTYSNLHTVLISLRKWWLFRATLCYQI